MKVQDFLRVLREQWIVMLLACILGVSGGAGAYYALPTEYTAKVTLYVSSQGGGEPSGSAALEGAQLSEQRVKSYVVMASSRRVATEVIARLGLPDSPGDLADRITASSPQDSVLVDIAVVDPSREQAALLANTVGDVFTELVADVERPFNTETPPVVAARVMERAEVPEDPSSLGLKVLLALGLLGGLSVGVALAVTRNALDTSIKSPEQMRAITGAPVIGAVAHDPKASSHPLVVSDDPHSPRSEAFRQLRTNLQFIDVDRPRRVLLVTSAMPGEGKTTTVANLAVAMAAAGNRVLVIDADLRRPRLGDVFGLDHAVGLTSVLTGRVQLDEAIQRWGSANGVDVLASGPLPPNPSELLASGQMETVLRALRNRYDVVLLDTPPLLPVADSAAVAPKTDGAILLSRSRVTTRQQLEAAVEALRSVSAPLLGTVLTMGPGLGRRGAPTYYSAYHADRLPVAEPSPPVRNGNGFHLPAQLTAPPAADRAPGPDRVRSRPDATPAVKATADPPADPAGVGAEAAPSRPNRPSPTPRPRGAG